ncbi:alpha/beta fold hydrolase BchO [Sedimentitalea todarodis]|uniref:Alpha/beta fold hydrolase n=1 Tax=Sedimentitalea todarodis TaxID=1631240 RepID=A0ABU3VKP0_9RHOB|nr:alpha/beta fold hydrolase BchO [Sedimentitalea todarodis]MDU9006673.1 alpha/beta fold hydrolase [Sedimentitalea todarodis]
MDWERDLPTWPLNHLSRRVVHGINKWHVQETGTGDTLLLLHGAGASTHSWRDLIPLLAETHHVVALDLPGHGFTQVARQGRSSLTAMTQDIAALCTAEGWAPSAIIGHSAGAAIALNLVQTSTDDKGPLPAVIGINAALGRFEGIAGWLFPLLAKLLALNPLTSLAFSAGRNTQSRARRLIQGTGSTLTEEGIGYYARLISDRNHVEGALQMMAQWNIDGLLDRMATIKTRCQLIIGGDDRAVKPEISMRAAALIPQAEFVELPKLGHLAHEERPQELVRQIQRWLEQPPVMG